MNYYTIDTHILVWYFENNPKLSKTICRILDTSKDYIIIPIIVLGELKYLIEKGRIKLEWNTLLRLLYEDPRMIIKDLDLNILKFLPTQLNIHDGLIVATALYFKERFKKNIPLLTKDKEILRSNLLKTIS